MTEFDIVIFFRQAQILKRLSPDMFLHTKSSLSTFTLLVSRRPFLATLFSPRKSKNIVSFKKAQRFITIKIITDLVHNISWLSQKPAATTPYTRTSGDNTVLDVLVFNEQQRPAAKTP